MKILLAVATTTVLAIGAPQAQVSKDEVRLTTAQSAKFGTYVADGSGRALYMFTADRQGTAASVAQTNCYDRCAVAWPPLVARAHRPSETSCRRACSAASPARTASGR